MNPCRGVNTYPIGAAEVFGYVILLSKERRERRIERSGQHIACGEIPQLLDSQLVSGPVRIRIAIATRDAGLEWQRK